MNKQTGSIRHKKHKIDILNNDWMLALQEVDYIYGVWALRYWRYERKLIIKSPNAGAIKCPSNWVLV